jgi:exodeoxyribonuclease VII small subunit
MRVPMSDVQPGGSNPGEQTFEACLAELQGVVRLLEEGALGLEESIAGFERGISLLRHCYQSLEQAEQRIEILTGFDRSGNPIAARFDAAATLEAAQGTASRTKKAARPVPEPEAEPESRSELSLPEEGQLF